MMPVDVLKFNPVDIVGIIEYDTGKVPPLEITGAKVTSWSIIKKERETVCVVINVDIF